MCANVSTNFGEGGTLRCLRCHYNGIALSESALAAEDLRIRAHAFPKSCTVCRL
jgi:hypothetical protein